jgi:hypothetical protein
VLLIGCGSMLALGVMIVGAGAYWFSRNKDRLVAMGKQAGEEATAFAAGHTQHDCVGEGLTKIAACDDLWCEAGARTFVKACIQKASSTPGFCDGVPARGELLSTARWIQDQCGHRAGQPNDQKCSRLMQSVAEACHAP